MPITTLSSRTFNQDTSRAKKAAQSGPVFITDRGKPAHVLLSIRDYQRVLGKRASIADLLAMPSVENVEMEIPDSKELARPADLS
jgi:prevent-host-death family protein